MKKETKDKLYEAWLWCDTEDKSTEFMLTYMAEIVPSWDESDVAEWIGDKGGRGRSVWLKERKK